jgi:hypothetical protein
VQRYFERVCVCLCVCVRVSGYGEVELLTVLVLLFGQHLLVVGYLQRTVRDTTQ